MFLHGGHRQRNPLGIAGVLAMVLLLASAATAPAADALKVDPAYSAAVFKVAHLGISDLMGRINDPSGDFTIDEANPAKSVFNVEFRVANIDTHIPQLDQRLKSADFFDEKKFPAITFKSTSVKKVDDTHYDVTGDLSLHGVTKTVTVTVTYLGAARQPNGDLRGGVEATFTIKRHEFGMTFMEGKNGFGDEVTVMVDLEGVKEKE